MFARWAIRYHETKKKMHYFINGFTTWKEFQRAFFRGLFYADVFIFFSYANYKWGKYVFQSYHYR